MLAKLERENYFTRRYHFYSLTGFGALAFLNLGREDDAQELARIAVSSGQGTEKWPTLVMCHIILGEIAAKRGQLEQADDHFAQALESAKTSRLPMLALIAARDWKKQLLEPAGRDCGEAEVEIDGACAAMGKTRAELGRVLSVTLSSKND